MCDSRNKFCYVCGLVCFATKYHLKKSSKIKNRFTSDWIKSSYELYFDSKFDESKPWIPDSICDPCHIALYNWYHAKSLIRLYKHPVYWREASDHDAACFFCNSNIRGLTPKNRDQLTRYHFSVESVDNYSKNLQVIKSTATAAVRFAPNDPSRPFPPQSQINLTEDGNFDEGEDEIDQDDSSDFEMPPEDNIPNYFNQVCI